MNFKKLIPYALAILFLIGAIGFKASMPGEDADRPVNTEGVSRVSRDIPAEMRGVWVTYMTLDVENEADKEAAFDSKIDRIIRDMKQGGFNTMIVQVRPFCDAIYPSRYFPWSHIISGEQGVDPGFDPLGHIVEKCRKSGVYIHAWVNPYRISTENTPGKLSSDHPYSRDETIGIEIDGKRYLNPASDKAIELIANGVRELTENYDIDGVQFDDYFYPENCGNFDLEDYKAYQAKNKQSITLEEFRKSNVSRMIRAAYEAVHKADDSVMFGVSPQGNLGNNDGLFADVKTWCAEKGYIDYICPQIYFSLDNPALNFEESLDQWLALKQHKSLRFYVGLSGYKAGTDADDGTWLDNDDILETEIGILRERRADGFLLYSYDSFHNEANGTEIRNVMRYLTTSATQQSSAASVTTIS